MAAGAAALAAVADLELSDATLIADIAAARGRFGEERPVVVAVAGDAGGRPVVVVATNALARERTLQAGALVKVAAQTLGGGGGGKDDLAQGGGQNPAKIAEALEAVAGQIATAAK